MGVFDISDKLRNYHRIKFEVRNKNWWWYIFFWGVGFILNTAYIIYI